MDAFSLIGSTISHSRIMGKLGQGGRSGVYCAEENRLSRHVAIKILPDEFARDEAQIN